MNEHIPSQSDPVSPATDFVRLTRSTLRLPGGRRSISNHVRRLQPAIASLRADHVGWKWIAEVIRVARHDPDTIGYAGTIRAAYARAGDPAVRASISEEEFTENVRATLRNAVGMRTLSDQVRRLAPSIAAARADGVSWSWLAEVLARERGRFGELENFTVQLRSLYHRVKSDRAASPPPLPATPPQLPQRSAPEPYPRATPPHVAAVAPPPARPPKPSPTGRTGRIRSRNRI